MPVTGVVLAGGESRRMGTDKARLKVGDKELIHSVVLEMQKIVSEIFVVCSPNHKRQLTAGTTIDDIYTGCGPLGGIHSALVHSSYPFSLVVACDMPFFSAGIGDYLIKQAEGFDAVVPIVDALPEPLLAVYGKGCIEIAEQRLANEKYKITGMYAELNINYIGENRLRDVDDVARVFFNVNTYRDLKKAQQMTKGSPKIPVVGIAGWSNSGKTTLLEKLIPELKRSGARVAVVKHHGKSGLDLDQRGKDTWRFARSGADIVTLAAPGGLATYNYSLSELNLDDVLYQVRDVDIILVEGYKKAKIDKIGILGAKGLPPMVYRDLVAIVGNEAETCATNIDIPFFMRHDIRGLARFIEDKYLKIGGQ